MPHLINQNPVQDAVGKIYDFSGFSFGDHSFAQLLEYLPGVGGDENWFVLKMIMGIATIVLAILFGIVVSKLKKIRGQKLNLLEGLTPPPAATSGVNARWDEVRRHIESTREAEWKFAVIEADKLVDDTLKGAGFPGETMGERLMNIDPGQLTTLQDLWEAHKIRNRLVHDTNYFLRYAEAKRAVNLFEKTLRELQAI